MGWRAGLGLGLAAVVAGLGAVMLGEYEFSGSLPFVAGPIFGLAVAEVAVGVGKERNPLVGACAGVVAFAGVVWAGWIDSSEGVEPVKGLVWVAALLGAAVAFARAGMARRVAR